MLAVYRRWGLFLRAKFTELSTQPLIVQMSLSQCRVTPLVEVSPFVEPGMNLPPSFSKITPLSPGVNTPPYRPLVLSRISKLPPQTNNNNHPQERISTYSKPHNLSRISFGCSPTFSDLLICKFPSLNPQIPLKHGDADICSQLDQQSENQTTGAPPRIFKLPREHTWQVVSMSLAISRTVEADTCFRIPEASLPITTKQQTPCLLHNHLQLRSQGHNVGLEHKQPCIFHCHTTRQVRRLLQQSTHRNAPQDMGPCRWRPKNNQRQI